MLTKIVFYGIMMICLLGIVYAIPLPDYTLYGEVTLNGEKLTKNDSNAITLEVDGAELVNFQMGEVNADAYALRVPMNSEDTEGYAVSGDIARIFVDGNEVDQSPITIGDFGITEKIDLTLGEEQVVEPEPDENDNSDNGGSNDGSSGSRDTFVERETIVITDSNAEQGQTAEPQPIQEPEPVAEPEPTEDIVVTPISAETDEEQTFFQRLASLFKVGATGGAVAETQAKPLIGIIIILVVVAIGLSIAYFVIFQKE
jgi:hypothetical protein